jgi:hypothetical protein
MTLPELEGKVNRPPSVVLRFGSSVGMPVSQTPASRNASAPRYKFGSKPPRLTANVFKIDVNYRGGGICLRNCEPLP